MQHDDSNIACLPQAAAQPVLLLQHTGTCNEGYASGSSGPPAVSCVKDAAVLSGGRWSTTATGQCVKVCNGPLPALANGASVLAAVAVAV